VPASDHGEDGLAGPVLADWANYSIDNMAKILAKLQRNGVEILKGPESDKNGKFAWILDPDGKKVELWEPIPWDEGKPGNLVPGANGATRNSIP
jgi:hypothetical protein